MNQKTDASNVKELIEIMARLRGPDGCPWDREQTHQSLRQALIEECYELVEALDALDDKLMCEELGDILLHVVFHAQMAGERGAFVFDDVVNTLCEKLVRRHPHVFGNSQAGTSSEVLSQWEAIKKKEKPERVSALDGVPCVVPALMQAQGIQKKAAKVGFDWSNTRDVLSKIREETAELEDALNKNEHVEEELGDLLFSVVNLSRYLKLDAEQACRLATKKFISRFQTMEKEIAARGLKMEQLPIEELEKFWQAAKSNSTNV
jgi:tetrapyrrole methylase family protein/MazG family protein